MTPREAYEQWLKDFADDRETVDELLSIQNDEKEIEDRFYTDLSFGTAGLRGVLGAGSNRMNCYVVRRATQALAKYILIHPRPAPSAAWSSPMTPAGSATASPGRRRWCCATMGVKVYLFESLRPVPVLSFAVRHLKCHRGHRDHRQPQPRAVQRLQGLLGGRRPDASRARRQASPEPLHQTTYQRKPRPWTRTRRLKAACCRSSARTWTTRTSPAVEKPGRQSPELDSRDGRQR